MRLKASLEIRQNIKEEVECFTKLYKETGGNFSTGSWSKNRTQKILEKTGIFCYNPQNNILDFGCGTGTYATILSKTFFHITGVDIVPTNLKVASVNGKVTRYVLGDCNALPYRDSAFDIVVCGQTLHHFPCIHIPLEQINRVLKKGGLLFILEPNKYNPIISLQFKFRRYWHFFTKRWRWTSNERPISIFQCQKELKKSGFYIKKTATINFAREYAKGIWHLLDRHSFLIEKIPLVNLLGGTVMIIAQKK